MERSEYSFTHATKVSVLADLLSWDTDTNKPSEPARISSGYRNIDTILNGGFEAGKLHVIAAYENVGKTQLALEIAHWVSKDIPVAFFSFEDDLQALASRLARTVAWHSRRNGSSFSDSPKDYMNKLSLYLQCNNNPRSKAIEDTCRNVFEDSDKPGLVIIDSLFSLGWELANGPTPSGVDIAAYEMAAAARQLNVPMLATAPLFRERHSRARTPNVADLCGTGVVEHVAQTLLLLDRSQDYDETEEEDRPHAGILEVYARKGAQFNSYNYSNTTTLAYSDDAILDLVDDVTPAAPTEGFDGQECL